MPLSLSQLALSTTLLLLLIACSNESATPPEPESPRPLNAAEKKLSTSSESFGLALTRQVSGEQPEGNVVVSPLSVAMALGMTYNGAAGTTKEAMESTLQFYGMTRIEINESFESLISLLTHLDTAVELSIANSIWYRSSFQVKQDFLEINRDMFSAEIAGVDFDNPSTAADINNWVSDRTNGKIEAIISPPISPLTMLLLINAVYFNGTWTTQFDEQKTTDQPFHLADGSTVDVPLMQSDQPLPYFENDVLQAAELPYGNELFRMLVILPRENTDVDSVIQRLDTESWRGIIGGLNVKPGHLYLPKFEIDYKTTLNSALSALGMAAAFDPGAADFASIADEDDLHISEVLHKTYLSVDERGTEAAAATGVTIGLTSVGPEEFRMRIDRPFFFVIRDSHSGSMLFTGRISDPTEN